MSSAGAGAVPVGSRIEVEWPLEDRTSRSFLGTVLESWEQEKKKGSTKRKYRIAFDDGDLVTTRLVHLPHKILSSPCPKSLPTHQRIVAPMVCSILLMSPR